MTATAPSTPSVSLAESRWPGVDIVVLLPSYNEAMTIADVVNEFRHSLPEAQIYVFDNNSTDGTSERARQAGAVVQEERQQGKGNVVRRMFADVDADIYVLADADLTYDISRIPEFIDTLLEQRFDMLIGARRPEEGAAFRRGHKIGNRFFNRAAGLVFGSPFEDIFSGFRVFSRRFVKSFPAVSKGFEIELELTVHAIDLRVPVVELPVVYRPRPAGSHSKLNTISDGLRILRTLLLLFKEVRPLLFFGLVSAVLALVSLALGYPLAITYLETGLVPRLPTAVLATGLMLTAFVSLACGLILDSVGKSRHEAKRLHYLRYAAPARSSESRDTALP